MQTKLPEGKPTTYLWKKWNQPCNTLFAMQYKNNFTGNPSFKNPTHHGFFKKKASFHSSTHRGKTKLYKNGKINKKIITGNLPLSGRWCMHIKLIYTRRGISTSKKKNNFKVQITGFRLLQILQIGNVRNLRCKPYVKMKNYLRAVPWIPLRCRGLQTNSTWNTLLLNVWNFPQLIRYHF